MEPSPDPADAAEALATLASSARAPSARARLGIGAAIVLFIVALVAAVLISALGGGLDETIAADGVGSGAAAREEAGGTDTGVTLSTADATPPPIVFVHVWGAVANAGLYELNAGARVVDVIAAAGGFADDAEPAGVNLARPLEDGEQLHVPRSGEIALAQPPAAAAPGGGAPTGSAIGGLVNLNTATGAELEGLPRIGPAMAQRIVEWRDANGGFAGVDDLRNVTGIGEKTFDGLKDLVTT